jgi:hypothetical protein
VRVRVVVALALLLVAGGFILDMSGRAPRTAGSDHVSPAVFAATVPGGGTVCQPASALPADAASVQLLIGTYGQPVPALSISFLGQGGQALGGGSLTGAHEGLVTIPLSARRAAGASTRVCLHVGGRHPVVIGGESGPLNPISEQVNGVQQSGRISLLYFRAGKESWWQLLGTLDTRFGVGKASFFGDWTLPAAALLLLGAWVATVRLLARELR